MFIVHHPDVTTHHRGRPHNAETLLLDPITKDLYIITKENVASVFYLPYPQRTDTTITLTAAERLPLPILTAGDISSDGTEILLKDYGSIYYWRRAPGESVLHALMRPPVIEPCVAEAQGEAVCFTLDAKAYVTTSEFSSNVIPDFTRYRRKR